MIEINELRQGMESAFEELFRIYHEKLYFFFLKHTRDSYQAEELVQITFLKLWQTRANLSTDHTISEQLFRIAKTSMIDAFRKAQTEKKLRIDISSSQESTQVHETAPVFDIRNAFERGVSNMPPVQQRVFKLSRLSGFSNKEIASELSISVKTVERHMTKALRQLSALFFS